MFVSPYRFCRRNHEFYPREHQSLVTVVNHVQRLAAKQKKSPQGIMFAGFRDVDSASSGGASSNCSPTCLGSSAASSRSFGSNAKARLQDKQIEKGKAIMMRDYVSCAAEPSVHTPGTCPQDYQQCSTWSSQWFQQQVLQTTATCVNARCDDTVMYLLFDIGTISNAQVCGVDSCAVMCVNAWLSTSMAPPPKPPPFMPHVPYADPHPH